MKMPEKYDLVGRHSRGKGIMHRGNPLRLQWRTFAADTMAVRLQTVIDATMCAIIAQFIRDLRLRRTK